MMRFDDTIDIAVRYTQLGRRYQHLDNDKLGQQWAEAFGATIARPDDENARLLQEDLFAEHQLRRIKPPYEAVSRERDQLVAQLSAKLRELELLQLAAKNILPTRRVQRSTRKMH